MVRTEPGALAPEVQRHDEFVTRYGETGGWDTEDHSAFVEILKGARGDYAEAVDVVCDNMVGFTKKVGSDRMCVWVGKLGWATWNI